MVAVCNIGVLGREWAIWFSKKGVVEVEAVCCEGIDGYAADYIDAFTAGNVGRERGCGLCMRVSVWRSMLVVGF